MASLTNPKNGQQITVPDEVAESYTSRGWVRPGAPAPAEQADPTDGLTVPELIKYAGENGVDLAGAKRKPDILAAIAAGTPDAHPTD